MRIRQAHWHAYRLPYRRTITWSDTVEDAADYLMLQLEDDQGRTGVAEVTLKPTWSGGTVRSVGAVLDDVLLPMILDREFEDAESLQKLLSIVPENSSAKALVGSACELIFLQAAGEVGPIDVPMSWAVTRASPVSMAQEAEDMVRRYGFATLKVKGGQGFATDVEALRSIRAAVGAGVALTVDANWHYAPSEITSYVEAMANAGATVVEDPASLVPDAHFRAAVANAPVPLLVDFACASAWHAQVFLENGAKALSVKPGRYGLPEGYRIARLAEEAGARACIGLFGESALGTLVSLQAARRFPALTRFLPAELSFFLMLRQQVLHEEPAIRGGMLRIPAPAELPGQIDRALLKRHAL